MITTTMRRTRIMLWSTVSVLALGTLLAAPPSAEAACAPDPVGNGGVVTCTGLDSDSFQTTSSGVDVSVVEGATVRGSSRSAEAIELGADASLVNDGTIDANLASTAVFARTGADVVNNGTIVTPSGQGVTLQSGRFVNSVGGVVDVTSSFNSGTGAVRVFGGGEIRNEGTIRATGDNIVQGLEGSDGATLINAEGGTITVSGLDARGMIGDSEAAGRGNSLINSGTITADGTGFGAFGLTLDAFDEVVGVASTATNTATGVIDVNSTRGRGILAADSDAAVNDGTINMVGASSVGMTLRGEGVRGTNSGTISTDGDLSIGVSMAAFSSGASFLNTGTVETLGSGAGLAFGGGEIGFDLVGAPAVLMLGQDGFLENSGDLLATGSDSSAIVVGATTDEDFTFFGQSFAGEAFDAFNGNRILNSGLIEGNASGIRLTGDPESGTPTLFIDNRAGGQISGTGTSSAGIVSDDGSLVIVNAGTISGSDFGIVANGAVNLTNEAGGTLSGSEAAVLFQGEFNDTFVNAGLVSGRVDMGAGDDVVVVLPTSQVLGGASLGAGNDTLVFDGAAGTVGDAAFLAQNVPFAVGVERTEKRGEGTWRFVGQDIPAFVSLAPAFVLDGTVILGLNAPSIDLTNTAAGRVEGVGTVRNLVNEGAFAPAGEGTIGTLNVAGNLVLADGSTQFVDIASDGTSDRVAVTGTASIGGQLSVNGIAYPTGYPGAQNYTIITAAGGVTGTFAGVSDNLPDVDVIALYTANDVGLSYARQIEVPIDPENPEGPGEPEVPEEPEAPEPPDDGFTRKENALASVFGFGHASLAFSETLAYHASRTNASSVSAGGIAPIGYGEEPVVSRLPSMSAIYGADLATISEGTTAGTDGGFGVWMSAFGDSLSVDPDGNRAGYDSDSGGVVGGLEYRLSAEAYGAVFGIGGGYSRTDVDVVDGEAEIDSGHVGLYGAFDAGPLSLNAALSYSFADFNLSRDVMTSVASGSADGDAVSGLAEASYDIVPLLGGAGYRFAPAVRLRGVHATRDSFTEEGAGILNLSVNEDDVSLLYGGVGFKAETDVTLGTAAITADVSVFYENNFGDRSQTSFATATPVNIGFATSVSDGGRDSIEVGAGLAGRLTGNLYGDVRYNGSFGSELESHRGSAGLSFRF